MATNWQNPQEQEELNLWLLRREESRKAAIDSPAFFDPGEFLGEDGFDRLRDY